MNQIYQKFNNVNCKNEHIEKKYKRVQYKKFNICLEDIENFLQDVRELMGKHINWEYWAYQEPSKIWQLDRKETGGRNFIMFIEDDKIEMLHILVNNRKVSRKIEKNLFKRS